MFAPEKEGREKEVESSGDSLRCLLEELPEELLQYILSFLLPYERLRLGFVSKSFRNAVNETLGYDPFGLDPGRGWMDLGTADLTSRLYSERIEVLKEIATLAFGELHRRVEHFVTATHAFNQPLKLLATILKSTGAEQTDCLATLYLGDAMLWSSNFTRHTRTDNRLTQFESALRSRIQPGVRLVRVPGDVEVGVFQRHAEMRLIVKWLLAYPNVHSVELSVDKICCIFCAAQLRALGLGRLVKADKNDRFGELKWYNFAPIVMFFKHTRSQLWGPEVEAQFANLPPDEKRQVLYYMVCLTRGRLPKTQGTKDQIEEQVRKRQLGPPVIKPNWGKSAGAAPKKKARTAPNCGACGASMVIARNDYTGNDYWSCPNSPVCPGFTKEL